MRRKLVAGNWKMNGNTEFAAEFAQDLKAKLDAAEVTCDVMIAPSAPYLALLANAFSESNIQVAAQNVAQFDKGAYTGEVSASMLSDLSCQASLIGHSERRTLFGETDEVVAAQVSQLVEQGITPVLCVGETLEEREAGNAEQIVENQLKAVLERFSVDQLRNLVVAYEPVWAIGTGLTATPDQAQEMHAHLRSVARELDEQWADSLTILYGGSVNSKTAKELFAQPDIDGGLVGGASLKVDEFFEICQSA
ncbi:triose-phosphate isomerase [Oleiphilus sp. HI0125]|uniref:triose-phosphate isomerase n=2 Tax=Oleiphilus sp. HI0125 TaxID=1822266 RepID=UPI0007C2C09E|nr:triose-phosphate isomerase [Oleiphilus sp. HI0125]KZZ56846.1 triose-phosphate isomerase [Oleiphilus sp. HI0125]